MNQFNHSDASHHPTIPMDALTEIARLRLDVETLEERGRDSLDFYDCAVWTLKAALKDSYVLGQEDAATAVPEPIVSDSRATADLRIDLLEQFAQTAATDAERLVAHTSWTTDDPIATLRAFAEISGANALTPKLATAAQDILHRLRIGDTA